MPNKTAVEEAVSSERGFIIEYVSEGITNIELKARELARGPHTMNYMTKVRWNFIIDAYNRGNYSKFINHSCEENVEFINWTVNQEKRVGVFAKRFIAAGE